MQTFYSNQIFFLFFSNTWKKKFCDGRESKTDELYKIIPMWLPFIEDCFPTPNNFYFGFPMFFFLNVIQPTITSKNILEIFFSLSGFVLIPNSVKNGQEGVKTRSFTIYSSYPPLKTIKKRYFIDLTWWIWKGPKQKQRNTTINYHNETEKKCFFLSVKDLSVFFHGNSQSIPMTDIQKFSGVLWRFNHLWDPFFCSSFFCSLLICDTNSKSLQIKVPNSSRSSSFGV